MDGIRAYLLSVAAAALICGIIKSFTDNKGLFTSVVRMVCGLFLAITVISPVLSIRFPGVNIITERLQDEAEAAVSSGTATAEKELREIIKQNTQAYILDKAAALRTDISADVSVSQASPYTLCAVKIDGAVSPYARSILEEFISEELGIPKEAQQWTLQN